MTPAAVVRSAAVWHYASLAVGAVALVVLNLGQWFFFDEWSFLILDGPGLFEPHVGHWSTSPMLVYALLRNVFGLGSYLPWSILLVALHLAAAHLAWRLALASGAAPWIATSATAVVIVLGVGGANILWAFQIGFIGALVLGMLAVLLSLAERMGPARLTLVAAIAVFSLTWSGTALPMVAATVFVLWRRHGLPKAAIVLGVTVAVYLAWYLTFALGSPNNPDTGGVSLQKLFVEMPLFLGVMFVFGFPRLFPLVPLGVVVALALVVWTVIALRARAGLRRRLPALALGIAVVLFALSAAFSRAHFSIGGGASSRYAYLIVLLVLPLGAVALSSVVRRWRHGLVVACIALGALAGYQAVVLGTVAHDESVVEQSSRGVLSAAVHLYEEQPDAVSLAAQPDAVNAPDLNLGALVALHDAGLLPLGDYTDAELAAARAAVGLQAP